MEESVTQLLLAWSQGDSAALDKLTPLVYAEIHKMAERHLRHERGGHTLQPTALLHEAWMRLAQGAAPDVSGRAHFYAIASRVMRQVLVDHARRSRAGKRGGGIQPVTLSHASMEAGAHPGDIIALDIALDELANADARKARIIELRYFGGLTLDEIAAELSVSTPTVTRELRFAEAWLKSKLCGDPQ